MYGKHQMSQYELSHTKRINFHYYKQVKVLVASNMTWKLKSGISFSYADQNSIIQCHVTAYLYYLLFCIPKN